MNGSHDPNPDDMNDMDSGLRGILSPRPEAVERIVRNALASTVEDTRPRWRPASLVAAVISCVALLFVWQLGRARFVPEPAAISIVNEGGILIASSPSGNWLVRSAEAGPATPQIIILRHGEEP